MICWEFKSSTDAALDYIYGYQYDKDLWLMETYGFPFEVLTVYNLWTEEY